MTRKLPIGIQGFAGLRQDGYLYVDKTAYIYQLIHTGKQYFLSRPRRFGKSLLLSTMRAYWEGKKELFEGLAIEKLEADNPDAWKKYPVFYFDFTGENYRETSLENVIETHLRDWEDIYGCQYRDRTLSGRFQKLLELAKTETGQRSVVLVDEYDKALLETIEDSGQEEKNKSFFKSFFSSLKKADEYLEFVFITGVTKFNKVSIFSDLNQLNDISLSEDFSGLCGITEDELHHCFSYEICALADRQNLTEEECFCELKKWYDGYRFNPKAQGVYNPFSLLKVLYEKDFGSYWYETGAPTFLIKKIRESGFDVRKFADRTVYASEGILKNFTGDDRDLIPLLYQTGYLTIVDFDRVGREYTLSFPNLEVKYGFLENLLPEYVPDSTAGSGIISRR